MNWSAVAVASLFAASLSAQVPPAPTGGESRPKDKIERRAEEMREHLGTGRQVQSHVKVSVRLKNGNKLVGVVKDGRLVERVDGLRFVDAQARERGAGIRLWYSGGTRNYVFVPFESLQGYEVLQRLTNDQLKEMETQLAMAEKRAAERAAAAQKAAQGDATAEVPVAGAEGDTAAPKDGEAKPAEKQLSAEEQRWADLLKKYPPMLGWNKTRRDEIANRFVVLGTNPSDFEKAFVTQYEDWCKACRNSGVDPDSLVQKKPETKEERKDARDSRDSRAEKADRTDERANRREERANRRSNRRSGGDGDGSDGGD
ncbi:MAG: hypothetical protein H6835_08200 [Planctomycetes bacterium]|nr:hypothetical protein [Planctomycetota bacterium]